MSSSVWERIALAVLGLGTAIVQVIAGRRRTDAAPAPMPATPPPERQDAATKAEDEARIRERFPQPPPAPVADLTKPAPSSDDAITPRDMQ